jgi:membrane-associated phospholipid phosphatase
MFLAWFFPLLNQSIMKNSLIIVVLLATAQLSLAQYRPDTLVDYRAHPLPALDFRQAVNNPDHITGKSFILPGALVLYGVITLRSDPLTDFSEGMKRVIWTDNPHKPFHLDNYLMFAPAAAVYGLNLAGIHGEHNFVDRTMIYTMSNLFLTGAVFSLKKATRIERPDGSADNSFPSGHTAEAFASAEFLRQEYKDVSVWYGVGGYAAATAVGYLRIYNNKHWFNDVVAGAGIGIASTRLSYWLYPKIKRLFDHTPLSQSVLTPYYQDKTVGLSFVHIFK